MFNFNKYLDLVFLEKEDLEKAKSELEPSTKGLVIFMSFVAVTCIPVILALLSSFK
jgi:hypothetical protein